jgi:hypothetical protein
MRRGLDDTALERSAIVEGHVAPKGRRRRDGLGWSGSEPMLAFVGTPPVMCVKDRYELHARAGCEAAGLPLLVMEFVRGRAQRRVSESRPA